MRKFFIALSVLAALTFSVVPSQALVGLPDDVPGSDVIMPFLVEKAGGLNTFLVLEDVRGAGMNFHYTVWTTKSVTVLNDEMSDTTNGMLATDAWTIISGMAPEILPELEITVDGVVYYGGYITFQKVDAGKLAPANAIIGQLLVGDSQNGKYAGANAWIKEWNEDVIPDGMVDANYIELFSATSLASAKSLQVGDEGGVTATEFGLYPRYYINDANAATWLWIWKSTNAPADDLHIYFWNNDEKKVSSNLPLPSEMNFVDVEPYLPLSLWPATPYPKEGWIALETPDLSNAGFDANREWAGYTYIFATGAASESWSYLTNMHRDVFWTTW